ncbi:MAG TPA: sialidase family protein, partial [bacterium]
MNFKKFVVIAFQLLFVGIGLIFAQYPNIQVSDVGSYDPEEVTIAINPTNPLNLAAGANIDYHYYSFDGGLTWTETRLTSSLGVWGDPCVVFDAEGNLYFGHLSNPPSKVGYWIDRIVVQRSTDGGKTWDAGTGVGFTSPKNQDKEWLAVDLTNSLYRNRKYMAWTEFDQYGSSIPSDSSRILFSYANEVRWADPIRISDKGGDCLDDDNTVEGAVSAVGLDGEVYISWSSPLGILFDKSLDGGVRFGNDIFVTDQPGGWAFEVPGISRCNGFPVTACDISDSPYRGAIYIMWSDQRNGTDDTDVFLIKSNDGGETWGETKRVNDDDSGRHQFFPWITIDPKTGTI